jgi:hypothetical protein
MTDSCNNFVSSCLLAFIRFESFAFPTLPVFFPPSSLLVSFVIPSFSFLFVQILQIPPECSPLCFSYSVMVPYTQTVSSSLSNWLCYPLFIALFIALSYTYFYIYMRLVNLDFATCLHRIRTRVKEGLLVTAWLEPPN